MTARILATGYPFLWTKLKISNETSNEAWPNGFVETCWENHNKPVLIWDKKWTEQTILDQVEMFIYLFRMSQIAGPI